MDRRELSGTSPEEALGDARLGGGGAEKNEWGGQEEAAAEGPAGPKRHAPKGGEMTTRGAITMRRLVALAIVTAATPAAAQSAPGAHPSVVDAGVPTSDEIETLERQLRDDEQALASGNCAVACRALESMRRSVARLCQLDSGPRCARARAKVEDASTRVHASCPSCPPSPEQGPGTTATAPSDAESPRPAEREAPAPAAEKGKGGCASCRIGEPNGEEGWMAWIVSGALAWAFVARRRRETRLS
jgi:hypothetical protein